MPANLLDYDTSKLNILEWEELIKIFSGNCTFPQLTASRVFKPSYSFSSINQSLAKTAQILALFELPDFFDFQDNFRTLGLQEEIFIQAPLIRKAKIFELGEINQFVIALEFQINNLPFIRSYFPDFDHQEFKGNRLRKFIKDFRQLVSTDGDINYMNHPELARIYKQTLEVEQGIREKLSRLLNRELADVIQFNNYDVINDHFVVPIRSDRFNNSIGEIISRSETGNTLYIQPYSIKEEVYLRLQLLVELQNILYKINLSFNQELAELYPLLQVSLEFLQYIDEYIGKATFAQILGLNMPEMVDQTEQFILEDFFHPLIPKAVKNTVKFEGMSLIISGPNTGGKTVTLKSVALCTLLSHLGLYVPAAASKIPFFDAVFFMAHDNQDLNAGLSSFSAEIKEFTELCSQLKNRSLILIDEIFNSTSSDEASTLAVSLFEFILSSSDATICVSTHHEMLKKILQSDGKFKSCHVGFDFNRNAPTFRLHFGVPGSSLAHNIFKQLFKPFDLAQALYHKSLSLLDSNKVDYNRLLEELNKKQGLLDEMILENTRSRIELENKIKSFEGELELKRQKLEADIRAKGQKLLGRIEDYYSHIRTTGVSSKKALDKEVHSLRSELPTVPAPAKNQAFGNYITPDKLIVGEKYFTTFIGQEVILKSYSDKSDEAIVAKGSFTLKCPKSSLRLPRNPSRTQVHVSYNRTSDLKMEYDCRGMRLEEFTSLIEQILPELSSRQIPFISIIHGHGDGILKRWLRDYLKRQDHLKWESGPQGNDGETRIMLA